MTVNIYIRNTKKGRKDLGKKTSNLSEKFKKLSPNKQQKFLRFYESEILSQISNDFEDKELKEIFTEMGNNFKSLAKVN